MTSLHDLPSPVLHRIVHLLPGSSRENLSLTSKNLQLALDSLYGKVIFLGEPTSSMRGRSIDWMIKKDIYDICSCPVRACLIGKLFDPAKSFKGIFRIFYKLRSLLLFSNYEPIPFKYPNLVRKLHFEGRILPIYFEGLTTTIFNLKSLSFHWKALSSLTPDVLDPLYFPNLITLDVWGGHDIKDSGDINLKKLCSFIENVAVVLKNVFLSLRVLRLDVPNELRILMLLTQIILDFLEKHAETLLIFKVELIPLPSINQRLKVVPQPMRHTPELFQRMHKVSSKIKLRTLALLSYDSDSQKNGVSYLNNWTSLVQSQRFLKEFQGPGLYLKQEIAKDIISNNYKNLTVLHLCIRTRDFGSFIPFDCDTLSNCSQLRDLTLEGLTPKRRDGKSGIINVHSFPKSLKTLSIKELPVSTSSLEYICCNMKHLHQLRLIGVGCRNEGESGVTVQTLKYIVQSKHLKVFAISCESIFYEDDSSDLIPTLLPTLRSKGNNLSVNAVYLRDHCGEILDLFLTGQGHYEIL